MHREGVRGRRRFGHGENGITRQYMEREEGEEEEEKAVKEVRRRKEEGGG